MIQSEASVPLFVDTSALVAVFNEDDRHHEEAIAVLEGIGAGQFSYGPVFTSRYVLSETATTILYGVGHREAVEAFRTVQISSTFNILNISTDIFERTADQFEQYDDQTISFVDHMNGVLTAEYDIDHIFAFDGDFATLGLIRVPTDTGDVPRRP